jgi:hypothetical protein
MLTRLLETRRLRDPDKLGCRASDLQHHSLLVYDIHVMLLLCAIHWDS